MTSALLRSPSKHSLRNGMTLTLREATDNDVIARREVLEQARAEGRLYFRTSSWIALSEGPTGTLGSTSTTSSNRYRALVGQPYGASRPLEFAQEPDAGRLSIECNDRLFRLWPIDVTDYRLR